MTTSTIVFIMGVIALTYCAAYVTAYCAGYEAGKGVKVQARQVKADVEQTMATDSKNIDDQLKMLEEFLDDAIERKKDKGCG